MSLPNDNDEFMKYLSESCAEVNDAYADPLGDVEPEYFGAGRHAARLLTTDRRSAYPSTPAQRYLQNSMYGKRPMLLPRMDERVAPHELAFGDIHLDPGQAGHFDAEPLTPFKAKAIYAYGEPSGITILDLRVGAISVFVGPVPLEHFSVAAITLALVEAKMPPDQIEAYLQKRHAVEMPAAIVGSRIRIALENTTKKKKSARIVLKGLTTLPLYGDRFDEIAKQEKLFAQGKPLSTLDNRIMEAKREEPEEYEGAWSSPTWEEP